MASAIYFEDDRFMQCTTAVAHEPFVFVGIRREGVWRVKPASQLREEDLKNLDLLNDFQSASTSLYDLSLAQDLVAKQAAVNCNPFRALLGGLQIRTELADAIDHVCKAVSRMMQG
jgi:hypothetical protein